MTAIDSGEITQKTLIAKSMDEAKHKLYALYNSDYEITNKRFIMKGGFLGLGQHECIEVTYRERKRPQGISAGMDDYDAFNKNRNDMLKTLQGSSAGNLVSQVQMNELFKKMDALSSKTDVLSAKIDSQPAPVASSDVHPNIERVEELLSQNEFTHSYIRKITSRIKATFSLDQLEDFARVQRQVVDWIGESISIAQKPLAHVPRTVIIVGPTGVGKTTTLVKIAAQNLIERRDKGVKLRLHFITTDTMRVGAMEQLSRYGELFNLKVQKAESADDVRSIYEAVRDSVDMIFIDTSGYSPNDSAHIGAMKAMLDVPGMNPEVYLAVSASTKARDLVNIMQNYEPFGYKSVIITKCDESSQYGNVISVLSEKNKAVSYITNGQNAGGGIERASIVEALIRLENFTIDRIHIEDKFGAN